MGSTLDNRSSKQDFLETHWKGKKKKRKKGKHRGVQCNPDPTAQLPSAGLSVNSAVSAKHMGRKKA